MVIASAVIISVLPMSLRTGLKISSPASRMTQRLHWRDFILPEVTRQVGRVVTVASIMLLNVKVLGKPNLYGI